MGDHSPLQPAAAIPLRERLWDGGFPVVLSPSQTRRVLFGLLLLAVLPRVIAAWRLNAVCDDAYFYQWAATMWEQGRTATALKYLNVNVYPLILWGLNSAGLPWPLSGKLWGVLVSGLAVFPLFALMRRLFDDRVAALCTFLYAVHPRLILLSAEPIREPTFWFLFLLSADWIHRAATAQRGWGQSIVAGTATTLAIHTRTEGWALLVLLLAWPMTLAPANTSRRQRLSRIVVALAMVPAFLLITNLTLLRDHDRWEWGRFAPLRSFGESLGRAEGGRRKAEGGELPATRIFHPSSFIAHPSSQFSAFGVPSSAFRPPLSALHSPPYVFVNSFAEKLEYVNLVFLLIGALCWGRELFDRRRLPLLFVFGGILLAVWVRLTHFGDINGRYFLTAYLVALPTEAAGVLFVMQRLSEGGEQRATRILQPSSLIAHRLRTWAPAAVLLALTTAFWFKALTRRDLGRERQAELGLRIRREFGPFRVVEVDRKAVRVGHFALGMLPNVKYDDEGDGPPPPPPDAIIATVPVQPSVRQRAERCGLVEISPDELTARDTQFRIFARSAMAARTGVTDPR